MLKKIFLIISVLLLNHSFAQELKFALLNDLRIGDTAKINAATSLIEAINKRKDISFTVIIGSISESGSTDELKRAKEILDKLKTKYYVVPGLNDYKWSESFGRTFISTFGDDKFVFELKKFKFIGLNSNVVWRHESHFSVENIAWVDSIVTAGAGGNFKYFLFSSNSINAQTDNGFVLLNSFSKQNIAAAVSNGPKLQLTSHTKISSVELSSSINSDDGHGFVVFSASKDSLILERVLLNDSITTTLQIQYSKKHNVERVDSVDFENYETDILWDKLIKESTIVQPVYAQSKTFITSTDGSLHCIDSAGAEVWSCSFHSPVCGNVVLAGESLITATLDGDIYSLDPATGKTIQSIGTGEPFTSYPVSYKMPYRDDTIDVVILGTAEGKMICYDAASMNSIWECNKSQGRIETRPLIIGDRIIYGAWDGSLYCIDKYTGVLNWRWTAQLNMRSSPAACFPQSDGEDVYITSPDGAVTKVDLLLGTSDWTSKECNAFESIGLSKDLKKVFVKSRENKFFILSSDNGKIVEEYDLPFGRDYSPIEPIETQYGVLSTSSSGFIYLLNVDEVRKILFMGSAPINRLTQIDENHFIASNADGRVVSFQLAVNLGK